ncbi:MAG: carboxypeptidase-like regulatory domain-containing protein [Prevotella sp.]|nr:carboxypeptidase-like regulatory domain-containing protein [Prevotella sp.]
MTEFLTYDLKVAALIAVFYMFYRLLLAKDTFHRLNRIVLLATAVASFVLPLCVITIHHRAVVPLVAAATPTAPATVVESSTPLWPIICGAVFFLGMAISLTITLTSVVQVVLLIRRSERHPQPDGTVIVVADTAIMPFSWLKWIVLNRHDYAEHNEAILAHERAHIAFRHSCDLLLIDTLTALQWFNPALWMLRADLRAIHEFEADAAVLSHGINARQYQYLLIRKAAACSGYTIANGFSHSTLKNRIHMMLKQSSNRKNMLKLIALLPIVGVALALNAREVTDMVYQPADPHSAIQSSQSAVPAVEQSNPVSSEAIAAQPQNAPKTVEVQVPDGDKTTKFSGIILDKKGKPVVGAIVIIAGTNRGTVTGPDGKFSIEAPKGSKLVVSYVGKKTANIEAKDNITTVLEDEGPDGAVNGTAVPDNSPSKESNEDPVKVAGPGKALIIVDGKEVSYDEMNKIAPSIIKSVNVLNGKSATDMYGERGAHGVVVITLK